MATAVVVGAAIQPVVNGRWPSSGWPSGSIGQVCPWLRKVD
jgi:hypothetical protein